MTAVYQKHKTLAVIGMCLLMVLPLSFGYAADFRAEQTLTLDTDIPRIEDLYAVGMDVTVHGGTEGDIFIVAREAHTDGPVSGDVFAMSWAVVMSGHTTGDIRIIGGDVTLRGSTTEDVVIVGENVLIDSGADIGGDLIVYGGHVEVLGPVHGSVDIHARSVLMQGVVAGDVTIDVRESLALSGDAYLSSNLTYTAPRKAVVSENIHIGGETYFSERVQDSPEAGVDIVGLMISILVTWIGGMLVLALTPHTTRLAIEQAISGGWTPLLVGLGVLIATPIGIVLLWITVLGIIPGFMLLLIYGLGITWTLTLSSIFAGAVIARWLKRGDGLTNAWVLIGSCALSIIPYIPVIGTLVRFLVFLALFGTLCALGRAAYKKHRVVDGQSESVKIHHEIDKENTTETATGASTS